MGLRGVLEHEQAVALSEGVDLLACRTPVRTGARRSRPPCAVPPAPPPHRRRSAPCRRCTSQKTGVAPACSTPSAEAMNVWAGTSTSSPGPMPGGDQSQRERGRARGHPHALRGLTVIGKLPLERLDLVAEDECVGAHDSVEGRLQLTGQRRVLAAQAYKRNDLLASLPLHVHRPYASHCADLSVSRARSDQRTLVVAGDGNRGAAVGKRGLGRLGQHHDLARKLEIARRSPPCESDARTPRALSRAAPWPRSGARGCLRFDTRAGTRRTSRGPR